MRPSDRGGPVSGWGAALYAGRQNHDRWRPFNSRVTDQGNRPVNPIDEETRNRLTDTLTLANVDARNLAIEVVQGGVQVSGTVPNEAQERTLRDVLDRLPSKIRLYDVGILPVAPSDSVDGRGRSPITGTSADSAHESRHQLDRD